MSPDPPEDPRRRLGALGERLAREHLERAGYRVLERNYRSRRGEIDVVALGHGALVFCEVKTRVRGGRAGPAGPLEAIGRAKQRRLRVLAREWLSAHEGGRPGARSLRFDAIGVTLDATGRLLALEHVEAAF
jgi:putative endonuclease